MIKIAFCDPHISEDSFVELEEIFKEICRTKGDLLVMCGDFYEKNNPTSKELEFGTKWAFFFKKLYDKVVFVKGNHDKDRDASAIDYLQYLGIEIVNEYIDKDGTFYGHFMTDQSTYEYGTAYKKVSELKKYNFVILGHQHCVSQDTECLTEAGWKFYNQLKQNEKIATFNMVTKQIEYQPIINLHQYDYKGQLLEFDKRALVTSNHRMILFPKHSNKPKIKLAYQIRQSDRMILNSRNWKYNINLQFKNKYWAELIGYIIGDGSYENINTNHFTVQIHTNKKDYSYLYWLLNKCKIKYRYNKDKYLRLRIHNTDKENKEFLEFLKIHLSTKLLTRQLISLPYKQLILLYRGLIASDGHHYEKGNVDNFSQKNKITVQLFEELCLRIGKTFKTYPRKNWRTNAIQYQVNIRTHSYHSKILTSNIDKLNIKLIPYKGIVWCPEVENGTWIAKRNGRPFITGNSFQVLSSRILHPGSIRYINFNESKDEYKYYMMKFHQSEWDRKKLGSPIQMKDFTSVDELSKQKNKNIKARLIINSYAQFKNEINDIEEYKNKFKLFKLKLDIKEKTIEVDNNIKIKMKKVGEILRNGIKNIKDEDVRKLLEDNI